MNKPNPMQHMANWLGGATFLIMWWFIYAIVNEPPSALVESIGFMICPLYMMLAVLLGLLPGRMLGWLSGAIVYWLTQDARTVNELAERQWMIYGATFGTSFLAFSGVYYWLLAPVVSATWFFAIPATMSLAMTYVAHRYYLRLRHWQKVHKDLKRKRQPARALGDTDIAHLVDEQPQPELDYATVYALHEQQEREQLS
ncbi:MAG: hypothetical protein AAFN11_14555 [Chloroflexota bacterium]